jgi:ribosomal protein S18 acetylase RimI-like enzyme
MLTEIREATNWRDHNRFMMLPYVLNQNNPIWVPPLLVSQKEILNSNHPFWKKNAYRFFLAFQGDRCVGRIASFLDQDHEAHFKRRDGFFGFLEAIDDQHVFKILLTKAEEFLQSQGCSTINGPFNPNIHYELGILIQGFDHPPFYMLTYNKSFYDEHIHACGYQTLKDFYSYRLNSDDFQLSEKMARIKAMHQNRNSITIRTPNLNDFINELKIFHDIYNNAFIGHWGFSPISWEDFLFLGKDMKLILDKEMVLIVEKDKMPVGFLLAIPNLNEVLIKIKNGRLFPFGIFKLLLLKRRIKSLRVITVAIKHEYQHLGIGSILYPEIAHRAKLRGYKSTELSWVVDDNNQMNKISKETGGVIYKRHRLYAKTI